MRTAAKWSVLIGVAHGALRGIIVWQSTLWLVGERHRPGHVLLQLSLLDHLGGHDTEPLASLAGRVIGGGSIQTFGQIRTDRTIDSWS